MTFLRIVLFEPDTWIPGLPNVVVSPQFVMILPSMRLFECCRFRITSDQLDPWAVTPCFIKSSGKISTKFKDIRIKPPILPAIAEPTPEASEHRRRTLSPSWERRRDYTFPNRERNLERLHGCRDRPRSATASA